jgi:glucosamine kinase
MSERLFIGVDGGATNCRARIADSTGRVLGDAVVRASANIASRSPGSVMNVILRAIRKAARRGNVTEDRWRSAAIGMGLAGADVTAAVKELRRLLAAEEYFRRIDTRTDAYVTWLGAYGGGNGAILILGTGSCGLAVVDGAETYVAGYGPQISDEASAQWMGRMAIRRSLWAFDGRIGPTPLARNILDRFSNSPEAIVTFAKDAGASDFGKLAPVIFEHAERRDPLAVAIVKETAIDAERIVGRLLDLKAPSVYLHGGIAEPLSRWLRPVIRRHLKMPMNVDGTPLDGALLLARRAESDRRSGATA